jgi:hypothetical protein
MSREDVRVRDRTAIFVLKSLDFTVKETLETLRSILINPPSRSMIYDWYERIDAGDDILEILKPTGRSPIDLFRAQIKSLVEANNSMSLRAMEAYLKINKHTIRDIMKYELSLRKTYYRWVPHILSQENKDKRVEMAEQMLFIL